MPIKLLLEIYDTMVVPILLYPFTPDQWEKTEIEKQHTSLLKQIFGLNRYTPNIAFRAEFGRLPLLLNSRVKVWNYIKYLRKKTDSCIKEAYNIDSDIDIKNANFKEIELGIKQVIVQKSQDPYTASKERVKLFLKNDYVEFWKDKSETLLHLHPIQPIRMTIK